MSQSVLASRIGVSFQQVQKYERGTNRISASMLFEIAQALHMPIQAFYEGLWIMSASTGSDDPDTESVLASGLQGERTDERSPARSARRRKGRP